MTFLSAFALPGPHIGCFSPARRSQRIFGTGCPTRCQTFIRRSWTAGVILCAPGDCMLMAASPKRASTRCYFAGAACSSIASPPISLATARNHQQPGSTAAVTAAISNPSSRTPTATSGGPAARTPMAPFSGPSPAARDGHRRRSPAPPKNSSQL